MSGRNNEKRLISRRGLLKGMGLAPLLLRPAPFQGASRLFGAPAPGILDSHLPFADIRLTPHYPVPSPLADILRLVPPGLDEYPTEKYAVEVEAQLRDWGHALKASSRDLASLAKSMHPNIQASSLVPAKTVTVRSSYGIEVVKRSFDAAVSQDVSDFSGRSRLGWVRSPA